MISFYPGPSHVAPATAEFMKDALESGILGMNHRSSEFMTLMRRTKKALRKKLLIPDEYEIVMASSATECWEIIAQSLASGLSYHLYNGAFGEKWFKYTQKIHSQTLGLHFDPEQALSPRNLDLSEISAMICLTQNETSNGTRVSGEILQAFREAFPDPLIAIDATSSMAGEYLDFASADVWFASVQKCFGLPSGLAVMILSPKAVEAAYSINERRHYNSLAFMLDNFRKNQTPYTPNILGIYLLFRTMKRRSVITKVNDRLVKRMVQLEKTVIKSDYMAPLISNQDVRSQTVMAIETGPGLTSKIKKSAREHGFLLGNGYGAWKDSTIRIANFPAVSQEEWKALRHFLKSYKPGSAKTVHPSGE